MNAGDLPSETLFGGALNCRTLDERAAYLDQACVGQPELRRQLEQLLAAYDDSSQFLEAAAASGSTIGPGLPVEECSGTVIGRYKLLQKIGEGGMGVVYMTEQTEPLVRKVALKIIKLGMDTRQVVARFEAERQALALMDHPNIAKVLDAGATNSGRPYFVMELVHGVPITEYCDKNKLSTQARLELFIPVCQAIQHAHQKGIIHRDIKPSNVMVTLHDGVPVPKVIDFGVAKATNQRLTEKTLFTNYAQMIGTPAYMSPEQAEMSGLDTDTRTDVYSLGVLLYELLTGTTPFDAKELLSKGYGEMQRMIAEAEPPRPSTRMSTLTDEQRTVVAENRSIEAGSLSKDLQGDLDWIVMKCLEKDRSRRYQTANGLAMDVGRHLGNEPVLAREPTAAYRFQKWVRRHRLGFAFALTAAPITIVAFAALLVANARISLARRAEHLERARAVAAGERLQESNTRLNHSLRLLQLQHAEDLFSSGNSAMAIASLTASLREDPSNSIAANRLVSALVHRNLALPLAPPLRHQAGVSVVRIAPDGARLLSGAVDGTARLWDSATGAPIGDEMKHGDAVVEAHFSPDGKVAATASKDGTVRLWDATTARPLGEPLRHSGPAHCMSFNASGSLLVSGGEDRFARLWEVFTESCIRTLGVHESAVTSVAFSPSGHLVATGSERGEVVLWSLASGTPPTRLTGHRDTVKAVRFSPAGDMLVSASLDGTARVWDTRGGRLAMEPLTHEDLVFDAVFSPDGRLIATACQDGTVRLWQSESGRAVATALRHDGSVRCLTFTPDGRQLATASLDLTARVWDTATGREFCQPLWHAEWVSCAQYSPDGRWLATASFDSTARLWDIQPRRCQPVLLAHDDRLWAIDVSPDGTMLATASADRTARVWDLSTGQLRLKPLRYQAAVTALAFSSDSRWVAAGDSNQVQVWDARTGQPRLPAPPSVGGLLRSVRFDPAGGRIVTGFADGVARVWDAVSGRPLIPPLVHRGEVWWADFSPDGLLLATASLDNTARVWDAQTGEPVTEPLPHEDHVKHVVFSPDSRLLLSASSDNCARIWDVRTGRLRTEPLRHTRIVERARFSPDGKRVVTASIDRTAQLWDVETGQVLTPPLRHADFVSDAGFSSDGQRVLTACLDGSVRLWDSRTGQPLTEPLSQGPRCTVNFAIFTPDNQRVIAMSHGSPLVTLWDVPPVPVPLPTWFGELAEEIVGLRLSSRASVTTLPGTSCAALLDKVNSAGTVGFYQDLARWLLAPPQKRQSSPFSATTASESLAR